jgi:DNA-binding transcriptional LysR family regulator
MELYQLRQFVAVAETGSFTKGAARVAVSQPSLSAAIAKLEEELGTRLLDRKRTAVVPTFAGGKFLERARTILQTCNEAKAELRSLKQPEILRMGVLNTLPTVHIGRIVEAFTTACPEASVQLTDGNRETLEERLSQGKIDLAITTVTDPDNCPNSLSLFSEHYVLVVGRKHRFADLPNVTLADLDSEALISRTHCETYRQTTELMVSRGIKTRVVYRTDQDDRVLGLVAAGLGIALMPSVFESSGIVKLPVRDFLAQRTIGLKWRDNDGCFTLLNAMLSFAKSHDWKPRGRSVAPQFKFSRKTDRVKR